MPLCVRPDLEDPDDLRAVGPEVLQPDGVAAHRLIQPDDAMPLRQPVQRLPADGAALQLKHQAACADQLLRGAFALTPQHLPVDADGDLPGQIAVKRQPDLPDVRGRGQAKRQRRVVRRRSRPAGWCWRR